MNFTGESLAQWCGGRWIAAPPQMLGGISHDTRTLARGDLFLAIKGDHFDGHAFVAAAFEKGAAGAVVQSDRAAELAGAGPLLAVDDTGRALCDMARGHRRALRADIIAVTGSAGKTTVMNMIAETLAAAAPVARTVGNWNNSVGMPLSLLRMKPSDRAGVFEVGTNHPGEIAALCATLAPDIGVITNVGPAHTEFFESVDAIAREKADVLRCLPAEGTAFLRRDGEYFDTLRAAAPCRVVTAALDGPADYECLACAPEGGEARIVEKQSGATFDLHLPVPGRHQVGNAMLAIAVARSQGLAWDAIHAGLSLFRPAAMRWEKHRLRGATIINDAYNANPLSMRAAVDTIAGLPARGRKWLVLAGMLELGERTAAEHAKLGEWIARGGWDRLVAVGDLAAGIAEGARRGGADARAIARCGDASEAARLLKGELAEGDVVLLKGSRRMRLETILDLLSA